MYNCTCSSACVVHSVTDLACAVRFRLPNRVSTVMAKWLSLQHLHKTVLSDGVAALCGQIAAVFGITEIAVCVFIH